MPDDFTSIKSKVMMRPHTLKAFKRTGHEMTITLTTYMKHDLYIQGFKDFNAGVKQSGFTNQEWHAIWQDGWNCAKAEHAELEASATGSIW